MAGSELTHDGEALRSTAREMLRTMLSCRNGISSSGVVARVTGDAIGADQFLPNMATGEFLKCLSKGAVERDGSAENVLPRNTGKVTREALIARVGQGTSVLPVVRFALTSDEVAKLDARVADTAADPKGDEDEFGGLSGDLDGEATGEDVEGGFKPDLPPVSNDGEPTQAAA